MSVTYLYQGAGDNAVSCSVMLEIIRIISRSSVKLKHNVIFLFNGAEENMLQVNNCYHVKQKKNKSFSSQFITTKKVKNFSLKLWY